mmetsp:Transcript_97792/g.277224  ORF Transcript_97792/g.277224 Transcript_97792/m.277224 type:complete len:230 (+) Transcript_97792:1136-1825(+)
MRRLYSSTCLLSSPTTPSSLPMSTLYSSMASAYSGKTSSIEILRVPQMTSTALLVLPSENTFQLSPMPSTRSLSARKYLASWGNIFEQPLKAVEMMALIACTSLSVLPVERKSMMSCVMFGAFSKARSHSSLATLISSDPWCSPGTTFSMTLQSLCWDASRMRSESVSSSNIWMIVVMASSPKTKNSDRFLASMPSITVWLYCGLPSPGLRTRAAPACPESAARRTQQR